MSGKLAIDGGTPVRTTPLPGPYPGATIIGEEEKRAVNEVLERRSPFRYYGPDPAYAVNELERTVASLVGIEHAVGVTSGTAALIVALRALGVGPGDEVIVPAATFYGCVNAVVACQAVPIFADLDESVSIAAESVESVITPRTRAVMVVHWRGAAADLRPLLDVGKRHGVAILEDCAQSFGAEYHGRLVGAMGDINIFSFQMNKVISAGEGGMVVTNDPVLQQRAIACQDQGTPRRSEGAEVAPFFGENYRMSELTAAVLLEQVKKLDWLRAHVRHVGGIIKESVRSLPGVRVRAHGRSGGRRRRQSGAHLRYAGALRVGPAGIGGGGACRSSFLTAAYRSICTSRLCRNACGTRAHRRGIRACTPARLTTAPASARVRRS